MSGPKVINVEALRAIQEREAIRILHRVGDCVAEVAASDLSAEQKDRLHKHLQSVLNKTAEMRAKGDWKGIIDQGKAQIAFVAGELETALDQQRNQEAERIQRSQNARFAITTVRTECERLKIPVPAALLEAADGTCEPAVIAHLVQQIDDTKATRTQDERSTALNQYASEFVRNSDLPTRVREIIQKDRIGDAEVQKVTELLQQAVKWASKDQISVLQKSAHAIATEVNDDRRHLLVDSFVLSWNEAKAHAEEKSRSTRLIKKMGELLAPFSGEEVNQMRDKISGLRDTASSHTCTSLLQEVTTWARAQELKLDALARRAAVLNGLASLGYEVREGMNVGWATQGKIVVEKAAIPGYGIEVTAPPSSQSLQVRVVAFRDQNDASKKLRDKEVEEKWCSEFTRLRTLLQSEGFPVELTHASAAGEHSIKPVGAKTPTSDSVRRSADIKTKAI